MVRGYALVIGLGIGQMYAYILSDMGYHVDTVDPNKEEATYKYVSDVKWDYYDIVVIATPNYLHEPVAYDVANMCLTDLIVVDKPGFRDHYSWKNFKRHYPNIRLQMVKNNLFRDSLALWQNISADSIVLSWQNENRIPHPGSWFTDKDLAFGGVSRDLMPHLLHIYYAIKGFSTFDSSIKEQHHLLENIKYTDYGEINRKGRYNVDDYCCLLSGDDMLIADWETGNPDDISISFFKRRAQTLRLEDDIAELELPVCIHREKLGLCPEKAYERMFETFLNMSEGQHEVFSEIDDWVYETMEGIKDAGC